MKNLLRFCRNTFSKDENRKIAALSTFGRFLFAGYRFGWPQMAWWRNKEFNDYLVMFDELEGYNTHRKWMLYQLLRLIEHIPGDTAECGVWRGASSYLICLANERNPHYQRVHYCFDSFEGLSAPGSEDGNHWQEGDLTAGERVVEDALAEFANVRLCKGWIPARFNEFEDRRFAFIHVDVDLHDPTMHSIDFFYERLNSGGIFLCDDYGCTTCPGVTKTIDEFLENKPEQMLALDNGGGFFIKGIAVANEALKS